MKNYLRHISRIISCIVIVFFGLNTVLTPVSYAQTAFLPEAGVMVSMTSKYSPMVIKGVKIDKENPFRFDFIVDTGDTHATTAQIKEEGTKLISYFLASLTTPEKEMWVNLSPYEKNRIIPESFGQTEMGKDVLAQDYMLKQIMATALYPERELGRAFWQKIYADAAKKFGTTQVPINTFNKVWILPAEAVVYENAKMNSVFVVKSTLKVMLEQDYLAYRQAGLATSKNTVGVGSKPTRAGYEPAPTNINQLGSQIIKEIVIPALEKEVNEGKSFATLRQVYQSLILATWYKNNLKDSVLTKGYANRNKTQGVNVNDPKVTQKIYEQYLKAYRKGVYNFVKEEKMPNSFGSNAGDQMIVRKYFSGGWNPAMLPRLIKTEHTANPGYLGNPANSAIISAGFVDAAMMDGGLGFSNSLYTILLRIQKAIEAMGQLRQLKNALIEEEGNKIISEIKRSEYARYGLDLTTLKISISNYIQLIDGVVHEGNKVVGNSLQFSEGYQQLQKDRELSSSDYPSEGVVRRVVEPDMPIPAKVSIISTEQLKINSLTAQDFSALRVVITNAFYQGKNYVGRKVTVPYNRSHTMLNQIDNQLQHRDFLIRENKFHQWDINAIKGYVDKLILIIGSVNNQKVRDEIIRSEAYGKFVRAIGKEWQPIADVPAEPAKRKSGLRRVINVIIFLIAISVSAFTPSQIHNPVSPTTVEMYDDSRKKEQLQEEKLREKPLEGEKEQLREKQLQDRFLKSAILLEQNFDIANQPGSNLFNSLPSILTPFVESTGENLSASFGLDFKLLSEIQGLENIQLPANDPSVEKPTAAPLQPLQLQGGDINLTGAVGPNGIITPLPEITVALKKPTLVQTRPGDPDGFKVLPSNPLTNASTQAKIETLKPGEPVLFGVRRAMNDPTITFQQLEVMHAKNLVVYLNAQGEPTSDRKAVSVEIRKNPVSPAPLLRVPVIRTAVVSVPASSVPATTMPIERKVPFGWMLDPLVDLQGVPDRFSGGLLRNTSWQDQVAKRIDQYRRPDVIVPVGKLTVFRLEEIGVITFQQIEKGKIIKVKPEYANQFTINWAKLRQHFQLPATARTPAPATLAKAKKETYTIGRNSTWQIVVSESLKRNQISPLDDKETWELKTAGMIILFDYYNKKINGVGSVYSVTIDIPAILEYSKARMKVVASRKDHAQLSPVGGIDLEKVVVEARRSGNGVTTAFSDPAVLAALLKVKGLRPIIYSIDRATLPMMNMLLGLNNTGAANDNFKAVNDNTSLPAKQDSAKAYHPKLTFIHEEQELA